MRPFEFTTPSSVDDALRRFGSGSVYLAGGTTLVDLMKLDVVTPQQVLDIDRLALRGLRQDRQGLHIAALERMSDVAAHRSVTDASAGGAIGSEATASCAPAVRQRLRQRSARSPSMP